MDGILVDDVETMDLALRKCTVNARNYAFAWVMIGLILVTACGLSWVNYRVIKIVRTTDLTLISMLTFVILALLAYSVFFFTQTNYFLSIVCSWDILTCATVTSANGTVWL